MDGDVKVFKNEKTGRHVSVSTMDASFVRTFAAYNKGGNLIGHANVMTHVVNGDDGKPEKMLNVLVDIVIYDDEERHKGAATELMEVITGLYDKVVTGGSTSRGRALCYKAGFKDVGGLHKNAPKYLLYERDGGYAVQK